MGIISSKEKLLDEPWRLFEKGGDWNETYRKQLLKDVTDNLPRGKMKSPKILLIGPIMAGKSSFINSVYSIDQGKISVYSNTGESTISMTLQHTQFIAETNLKGVRLYDTMGLEPDIGERKRGIDTDDVKKSLTGTIKPGYEYKPGETIEEKSEYFNNEPQLPDKCHCVVLFLDANVILQKASDSDMKTKLRDLQRDVQKYDAPVILILTKIDTICDFVFRDIRNTFKSENVKKCIDAACETFGITKHNAYPVRNYAEHMGLDENMDILILMALRHIVRAANGFLKKKEDQEVPAERFVKEETIDVQDK